MVSRRNTPEEAQWHSQFLLIEGEARSPSGWSTRELEGWILAVHPDLPVLDICTDAGQPIGWLLGFPIADSGLLRGGRWQPDGIDGDAPRAEALEAAIYSLGGRYAAVLLGHGLRRLYLDPGGTLACVYARDAKIAGATNTAVEWALQDARFRPASDLGELATNQFYPAGLTRSPGIRRVLPNHFLDLDRWETRRHWLHRAPQRASGSEAVLLAERIGGRIQHQVSAVCRALPTYLSLTAGRDSRMLLACSRHVVDRITFITFAYSGQETVADVSISKALSRRLGLRSTILPVADVDDDIKKRYLARIGYAGHWGKSCDFYYAAARNLDPARAFLPGFGGEVGRAFYWKKLPNAADIPAPEQLLSVMNVSASATAVSAMRRWLDGIQPPNAHSLLDQLYLEQRLGCWAAPHMYGFAPFAVTLTAFCHREVFGAMARLPVEYVRKQRLTDDVVSRYWPETASFPYQRNTGIRGVAESIRSRGRRTLKRLVGRP